MFRKKIRAAGNDNQHGIKFARRDFARDFRGEQGARHARKFVGTRDRRRRRKNNFARDKQKNYRATNFAVAPIKFFS